MTVVTVDFSAVMRCCHECFVAFTCYFIALYVFLDSGDAFFDKSLMREKKRTHKQKEEHCMFNRKSNMQCSENATGCVISVTTGLTASTDHHSSWPAKPAWSHDRSKNRPHLDRCYTPSSGVSAGQPQRSLVPIPHRDLLRLVSGVL